MLVNSTCQKDEYFETFLHTKIASFNYKKKLKIRLNVTQEQKGSLNVPMAT